MSGDIIVRVIRWITRNWARSHLALGVFTFVVFLPLVASAHTVAELTGTPASFDQQIVNAVGEITNVVTRYGEEPYTTFELLDEDDKALPVFVWGKPTFKQGDVCHVTGTFFMEKALGTHLLTRGVEAEKVEKVSEAEYKKLGVVFRKKKKVTSPTRGLYIPRE